MVHALNLTSEQRERATLLHKRAIVIDASIVVKHDGFFDRASTGGVTAVNHTVTEVARGFSESVLDLNQCRQWIKANGDQVALVLSADDIRSCKAEGKVGVIFGPQDTFMIEDRLEYLDVVYDLGVRISQLTYQWRNLIGNGCGERRDEGLSRYGLKVVKRMNELGMLIDLSHCGWRTCADAIEASEDPCLFTHTHPYSLTPHVRNKSDELIKALAAKGGVMGISGFTPIGSLAPGVRPNPLDLVTHIDYVANLVGIDHVGLGLDINENMTRESSAALRKVAPELYQWIGGGGAFPYEEVRADGLDSIADFEAMTRAMIVRGYSDENIEKVLGGNFLRVFDQVWDKNK